MVQAYAYIYILVSSVMKTKQLILDVKELTKAAITEIDPARQEDFYVFYVKILLQILLS